MGMKVRIDHLIVAKWRELVRFPDWNNMRMRAKLDTGARSSAIHAEKYEIKRLQSSATRIINEEIEMEIRLGSKIVTVTAPILEYRNVKNSGGKIEERPFIETTIEVAGIQCPIVLSVTNRKSMRFPLLLGRTFLGGRFLVDSSGKSDD